MRKSSLLPLLALLGSPATATASATTTGSGPLPFRADDYAAARAEATQRHLPLFVEVWAPW
jgi:hypothetical protein